MNRLICLLIGYAFGLIQGAYILGKLHGIDIRDYGSGNSGTTNALRVMGPKAGGIVLLVDALKCVAAVLIVSALFGKSEPGMLYLYRIYATAGCVLGHDYPFYMKFRGGKGVAVIAGFVLSFHWTFFPVAVIVFFVPFLTTHYVSLGSLILYPSLLILMIIEGCLGVYDPASKAVLIEMYILFGLLTAMAYYQHRANLKRLLSGTERKTYVFHKDKK